MDPLNPTISEARQTIQAGNTSMGRLIAAGHALMEACRGESEVTIDDMLRCLDYGGVVAAYGARCLYVRTGRDGLGWQWGGANGVPFVTSRADWESWLHERQLR